MVTQQDRWAPALRQNGQPRNGAQVADLTDLLDTSGWPDGTRLIVRREPCTRRPTDPLSLRVVPILGPLDRPARRPDSALATGFEGAGVLRVVYTPEAELGRAV